MAKWSAANGLGLPRDLITDFAKRESKQFDYFDPRNVDKKFLDDGLELAKKLKLFLKNKARIECEWGVVLEITLFYLDPINWFGFTDEDGNGVSLENILGRYSLIKHYSKLDEEINELLEIELDALLPQEIDEFNTQGEKVAQKVQSALPKNCLVVYKPINFARKAAPKRNISAF